MDLRKATPIGIDLGTAYTRVTVYDGNKWRMIPDDHGNSAMPSYVAFNDSGVLVGEAARKQAPQNPTNTIFDVSRLIGRRYSDPSVQNGTTLWPFQVRASPDDRLLVDVWCKSKLLHFTPVEICSMILIQMKNNAERNLRTTIEDAVITVPVHFNFEQRQAIRQAGMIAGLNFMQIVSAPAASALFYAMNRPSKSSTVDSIINFVSGQKSKPEKRNMIIIDVGAGTVDVSVVTVKKDICKVRATAGNIYLGGSDFDNTIVDHFINLLKSNQHTDISTIPGAVIELRTLCEQAKIALSSGRDMVPIMFCMGHLYNNVKFEFSINTSKFNELNKDLFMKCVDVIQTCIRDAKMGPNMVYEVILAGGSTRIPILKSYIHQCFKGTDLNPSEPFEDATAYGAAYQAFVCSVMENKGDCHLSLVDVIPFSLGIQSSPGMMVVELPKYTTIPTKKENSFHPYHNQTQLFFVEFYEDERRLFTRINSLGKFDLSGYSIDPNACHFKVCLEIHENYNMTVTTEEIYSGMRKSITTTNNNIGDSRKRVQEALLYKESENGINRASATKSLSSSGSSSNWDKVILAKHHSMHKEPKEYAIGVDFGTTYSCVAVWQRNSVRVIENEYGNRLTCSAVAFSDTGRLIGDAVHKEQVTANPANTIPNIKRLIGRCCDQSLLNDSKSLPFMVLSDDKKRSMLSVQYKDKKKHFLPEEIAAMILSKMKEVAEAHLSSKVTKAVVSVPACFSDTQRQAIKDAGVIAGLNVMQLLNEPTAAAIAYVFQKVSARSSSEKTLLIFDLGGGNLDVSILKINEGTITVVAIVGDTKLGGEDFDNNMVCYFVEKLMEENKRDIKEKPRSLRRLKAACEKAKRVLSTIAQTVVEIDALDEGIDFSSAITRVNFEELNMHLFKKCIECVERCLEDAKMDRSCIEEVVLVGGSTRIPMMQHLLQEFFNGKELCKSINADEAVVYGAAVQAAILSGNEESKKFNISQLQDVTSWSFGLESKDATIMNVVIPKHTPIPAKKELLFTNCSDDLPSFSLQVQECELESLTVFNISGITPKPKVKSKISVSLEVDESGILKLTAKDMTASVITRENNENIMISKENGNLTREEIDNMVQAAVCYKQDDEDNKKRAAELNSLEDLALRMKAEARDHCKSASGKKLEESADEAITWLDTHPYSRIDEINGWKEHLEALKSEVTTKV